ncbi:MAG: von Willebrand factor type A domain-containing protein [Anaerolineae bacterium]|nr:von Willebrand factor type A domain-containing protein [Anaerolineae bacterium]
MSHKPIFLIPLFSLAAVAVFLAFGLIAGKQPWNVDRPIDDQPPTVQVSTQWTGSHPVAYLEFDRPMDRRSVVDALEVEPALALDTRWEGERLRIEPRMPLPAASRYRFTLRGTAAGADGVPLAKRFRWEYRLDDPISDLTPPFRYRNHSTPLALYFSDPMDPASVEQSLHVEPPVHGEWRWAEGNRLALFTPAFPLPSDTGYTVYFSASLQDAAGCVFPPPASFQFVTPAAILSVGPQGDAVHLSAVVDILFDRVMNPQATEAAVRVTPELPGRFVWQGSRLIFEPDAGLAPATAYQVTVSPQALDRAGNPVLRQPYTWTFHTPALPDAAAEGTEAGVSPCEAAAGMGPQYDIAVRPLLPHDLVSGDQLRVSAIVHNHSVCTRRIYVALASDLLAVEGVITHTVILAAGQQRAVYWTVRAEQGGAADVVVRAVSGVDRDVVRSPLAVHAPDGGQPAPAGGWIVERLYVDVETGRAEGIVPQGQLVKVQLTVDAPAAASGVVVEDRLPAGLVALNPEGTASARYQVQEGRVRFLVPEMAPGPQTLTYFALAAYSGQFAAPPAVVRSAADEARVWGRSASGELAVEASGRAASAKPLPGGGGDWGYDMLSSCVGGTDIPNDEAYDAVFFENYGVNPFVDTDEDNLSTFAVDVDTGSYTIMRYYVNDGYLPPNESVRVEEYVNYFEQGYDSPPVDAGAFAVHLEGAPSLFGGEPHYLLRVGLQGYVPQEAERSDVVLTFVIDVSGSMNRQDRLELVKEALELLLAELRPSDRIGIAVYGSRGYTLLPHTPVAEAEEIQAAIRRLVPEGSTNAEEGLLIGYQMAAAAFDPAAINRVILCSDGVANVGDTGADSIWEQIGGYAEQGIYLTTVGFGMGNYNDVLMEQLADQGDGFYAYVDTLLEAERLFVYELPSTLQVIARDARVQVEFNPAVVRSYRLVGYENRDVADEDFRDDAVDGGEIGLAHSVTALYEIKFWEGAAASDLALTVYVRYTDPASGGVVEVSRSITWAEFAPTFEEASLRFQMAAVVAEYAEVLRGSYWARGSSLEAVLGQAARLAPHLSDDRDVVEFVALLERAVEISQREEDGD